MKESDLQKYLLERYPQENERCEWKEFKQLKNYFNGHAGNDVISYVSAISNMEGGHLVIGVKDKTLELVGVDTYNYDPQTSTLRLIRECPDLPSEGLKIEEHKAEDTENKVWIIHIPKHSPRLPVQAHKTKWQRVEDNLVPMGKSRLDKILKEPLIIEDWSAEIVYEATHDDLDSDAVQQARLGYYESFPDKKEEAETWDDRTFLDHARVTINGQITRTALLLLGKETSSHLIGHIAQMVWRLHSAEERAAKVFQPPFLLTAIKLRETIRNYQIKIFPNNALLPAEVWKYDSKTLLEALHNCIMHQDYAMNERIIVQEYVDRLTFINAGKFYEGSYEQYIEGKKTPSMYRNNFLKEAMRTLKMVDTQGFGIHDMFQRQRDRFLPLPDYDKEIQDHVVLNIPGHVINAEYSELLMQDASINLITAYLLDMVQKGKTITKEAAQYLRKKKLIEGRAPHYHIALSLAKKTKQIVHYTKEKGINKKAQLLLILELAKNSGENGFKRRDAYIALKDGLPVFLSEQQKLTYISHFLIDMHKNGYLVKLASGRAWKISEKGIEKLSS